MKPLRHLAALGNDLVIAAELVEQGDGLDFGGGEVGGDKGGAILGVDGRDVVEPGPGRLGFQVKTAEAGLGELGAQVAVGDEQAAFAQRGDVLDLVKAERAEIAQGAELAAFVSAAKAVGGILDHGEAMPPGQVQQRVR
jgi:hypothetical protein